MARSAEGCVDRLTLSESASTGSDVSLPNATAVRPTTTAEVQAMVREAKGRRTPLRIGSSGTWLQAGRPVRQAEPIVLDRLSGIVDYTPGDLTLTARAGTTLAEIDDATRAHGQWLALAPWGGDAGSLGATAATASAGPTSGALGAPRDVVIGVEAVTGSGDVVRGGGRVVKNVAGFDLTRLMVGAWGTLGILTEVSVRLRGLPEREATVALPLPNAPATLAELLVKLRAGAIAPLAREMLTAALAAHVGVSHTAVILARLVGNAESLAAQRAVLASLGDLIDVPGDVWSALRTSEPRDASVVRLSSSVAHFADTWQTAARLAAAAGGHAHGSVTRSTARVVIPHVDATMPAEALALLQPSARETRIFERLPDALWNSLAPSATTHRLARGVRAAFDPHYLLNPGILGQDVQ
jgi:glycolate oxidase FAD binding subunit